MSIGTCRCLIVKRESVCFLGRYLMNDFDMRRNGTENVFNVHNIDSNSLLEKYD